MTVNSKRKGARGEREVATLLKEWGFEARRGQQFKGTSDSPDIITNLPVHPEVKRTERFNLWEAMDQAISDAPADKPPVVFFRSFRRDWVVVMRVQDFLPLYGGKAPVKEDWE